MTPPGFLDLPGEIRNKIYALLLVLPCISGIRTLGRLTLGCPRLYPAILSTCQTVHTEARDILYGVNTFLAHTNLLTDLPCLRIYYDAITSQSLISLITKYHLRVRLDCDPNFTAQKATDVFSGMEALTIDVFQSQYGSSDNSVLKLFENVRGVRKVRVYGSVTGFRGYVRWLEESMMSPRGIDVGLHSMDQEDWC